MRKKEKTKFTWKKVIKSTVYRIIFWGLSIYVLLSQDIYPEPYESMTMSVAVFSKIIAIVGMFMVVLQKIHNYDFFGDVYKELLPLQAIIDEIDRRRYEKGKGFLFKIALYSLVIITCMTALVNEMAFWVSFWAFIIVLVAKFIVYVYVCIKY